VIDQWAERGLPHLHAQCTCSNWERPWNVWETPRGRDAPPAIFPGRMGYFRVFAFDEVRTRDLSRTSTSGADRADSEIENCLCRSSATVWVNSLFRRMT